nr:hypothetical protein [Tanacetum cinerariifolium]
SRLRIGKSNFRLRSDITSKESTLQVVYDVLILTPFYKAFFITADVPEIYMQEFWATATVHHHSIRFKMNNKKRIVNLEYFMEILHICPRIPNQPFDELPFKEEILAFLRNLGHSGEIKKITDVNIKKLRQPWRSLAAVINKCLSGKSTGYDIEHKDAKKSNEMYYPRFTKVIVNFFMTKDPSTPRRNKFSAILPVELTNEAIKNSVAYKEYYAIASGVEPLKTKASVKKMQSSSDSTMPPPMAKGIRLQTSAKVDKLAKGKQQAKSSTAKGLTVLSEKSSDEDDDDDMQQSEHDKDIDDQSDDESHDDQEDDDDDQDDKGNDDASHGMNVGGDEGPDAEDGDNELYGDLNINLEGRDIQMTDVYTTQVLEDTRVTLTLVNPDGQQQSSFVSPQFVSNTLNPSLDIHIESLFESTPRVDIPVTTT